MSQGQCSTQFRNAVRTIARVCHFRFLPNLFFMAKAMTISFTTSLQISHFACKNLSHEEFSHWKTPQSKLNPRPQDSSYYTQSTVTSFRRSRKVSNLETFYCGVQEAILNFNQFAVVLLHFDPQSTLQFERSVYQVWNRS